MNRLRILPLFLICAVLAFPLQAEEPPYLEFVKGLRDKHYSEQAIEYLQQLSKKKGLPLAVTGQIPLELARSRVKRADEESDPLKRPPLYAMAKDEFSAFLKTKPSPRMAAEANLELARVVRLQGKTQMGIAARQEVLETQRAERVKARPFFEEAAKGFDESAKQIGVLRAKTDLSFVDKKALNSAQIQADFEKGGNLFDQAQTYDDDKEAEKRGATMKAAIATLKKVASQDEKNSLCWEARAWLARCYLEIDSPKDARQEINNVLKENGSQADEAKRLARFFRILTIDRDPDIKGKPAQKEKFGTEWLETYPQEGNTPEGYGVKFQLAQAYLEQATSIPQKELGQRKAQTLFVKAEKLFESVERGDNEYSIRARDLKLRTIITRSGESSRGDISKLKDFQECFLRAKLETGTMMEEEKKLAKDPAPALLKKFEEDRKKHFKNMVLALSRSMDLADDKVPVADLEEAQYILSYAFLETDDPYRSAVVGEDMARKDPKSRLAPAAAAYALQAYYQIFTKDEKAKKSASELKTDLDRYRQSAGFIAQTWPTSPSADFARHHLGMIALRDKKYPEAINYLSKIKPTFGDYTYSQFQLATAAFQALRDNLPSLPGKPGYLEQAELALKSIPDLGKGADSSLGQVYFYAKLELAGMYLRSKNYKDMEVLTDKVAKQFAEAKLDENARKELQPRLELLPYYAKFGRADQAFRAGNYAEVAKVIDPLINQFKDKSLADFKDPPLIRAIFGLALRATVQEGKNDRAKEILTMLQKSAADLEGGTTGILIDLVQQLRGYVEGLRKEGEPRKAELEKTIESFSKFLENLASQPAETLTPDMVRFLAIGYAGLDKHKEAAELLAKFPAPADPKDQDKMGFYHAIQILRLRELRLAKNFDAAEKAGKTILASDWGKRSLDAQKEQIYLLEDRTLFGPAARQWNEKMKAIRPQIDRNGKLKDQYFDFYYHFVYCYYKNALKLKDETKRTEGIKRAANLILSLDKADNGKGGDELNKRYGELLTNEPALKMQYYDIFFEHVLTSYKSALESGDEATKREGIKKAAKLILGLQMGSTGKGAMDTNKRVEELLRNEAPLRKEYFDLHVDYVMTMYRNAAELSDEAKQKEGIRSAASVIIGLDRGGTVTEELRKRYDEQIEKEPRLKAQYAELKNKPA